MTKGMKDAARLALLFGIVTPFVLTSAAQKDAPSPAALARIWDAEHVSPPFSPLFDHAEVKKRVDALKQQEDRSGASPLIHVREIGRSLEGREIWDVTFGTGPFVVLMWSQMHGDEASATSALFDLYEYLQRHRDEAAVKQLLSALTVHTVPMLNPDGAERWQRRNAQGLDVNRDALLLQSPEGQLLKAVRDDLNPRVGFNLHNQSWNTTAGRPPRPAAISLLSVAYDEARSVNEARTLTKRLAAVVRDSLEPFAADRIGRYDDSFEVRAFGDNLTKWGTPVLLIETGPWPEPNPDPTLVRLNFIALVRALSALADGSVHQADSVAIRFAARKRVAGLLLPDSERHDPRVGGGTAVHRRRRHLSNATRAAGRRAATAVSDDVHRRSRRFAHVRRACSRSTGPARRLPRSRQEPPLVPSLRLIRPRVHYRLVIQPI